MVSTLPSILDLGDSFTEESQSAVWPGSSLQYIELIETPRYEDFEIQYMHKNPWAHMGMGFSMSNLKEGSDLSPYLQLENIDPKWLKAIGYKGPANEVQALREEKEKVETSGSIRKAEKM